MLKKSFIDDFYENSPFEILYENGVSPSELKASIIKTYQPYFSNQDRLSEYSTDWLVSGWVNFTKLKKNEWFLTNFEKCLSLFNDAKSNNKIECFNAVALWVPEINKAVTKFWSFKNLSSDLEGLEILDFSEESFKIIGQFLEGIIKSYLRLVVHLGRLSRGKSTKKADILKLDLGGLVDELISTTDFPELFSPPPWNVRLNQWRNIAYHHNVEVKGDIISCWYGKEPNIIYLSLTRVQLTSLLNIVVNIYNTIKNAEIVFIFDNLLEYQEACEKAGTNELSIRTEVSQLELFSGISSQGFRVVDYSLNGDNSKITLRDMMDDDVMKRAIHSSQFLYHLWLHTKSKNVMIEYINYGDSPYLLSSTTQTVCEKICEGKEDISYMASQVKFELLEK